MRAKIAIDISQIIYGTGVSIYTKELVFALINQFPDNDYVLFGGSLRRGGEIKAFASKFPNAKKVILPIAPTVSDFIWNRLHMLPVEKLAGNFDLFHSSDWAEPPSRHQKVTTLHDLTPLLYPKSSHPKIVEVHKRKLYWVKKESARVIVPSNASKSDAIKLGVDKKKIRVVHEAPSSIYIAAEPGRVKSVRKKYRINGKYALAVGATPRKNINRITQAFLKARVDAGLTSLVVTGRGEVEDERGVIKLGHVDIKDMPALYSGASVLVYPSLYEGFGLPILEAFSCGCPVVTSNISSMAEVAGKAAVTVDPESVEEIQDGIVKTVKHSKKYVKSGQKRVSEFSWEKAAKKTMDVYRELI